jgi:2-polyprenyl-3-methyl-5-hydroxy-6-metoxy-1,4-benzoquinol methylase
MPYIDFSLYDRKYWVGGTISGYGNYECCRDIVRNLFDVVNRCIGLSKSYLDVGCAYGFIVERARELGVDAWGVEPPTYALQKAREKAWSQYILEDYLPELKNVNRTFEIVSCYEVFRAYSRRTFTSIS